MTVVVGAEVGRSDYIILMNEQSLTIRVNENECCWEEVDAKNTITQKMTMAPDRLSPFLQLVRDYIAPVVLRCRIDTVYLYRYRAVRRVNTSL